MFYQDVSQDHTEGDTASSLFLISGIINETGKRQFYRLIILLKRSKQQKYINFYLIVISQIFAGQDCFSTSVLHLLAQTDLITKLEICKLAHNPFELTDQSGYQPSGKKVEGLSEVKRHNEDLSSHSRLCKNVRQGPILIQKYSKFLTKNMIFQQNILFL